MHACDAAIVGTTLGQIRTAGIVDAGNQASGFKGRHGCSLGAETGFRVVGRQTVLHALRHVMTKYEKGFSRRILAYIFE